MPEVANHRFRSLGHILYTELARKLSLIQKRQKPENCDVLTNDTNYCSIESDLDQVRADTVTALLYGLQVCPGNVAAKRVVK